MTKIWNWIVGEVHTVETIMSDFTSKVKQLEAHAATKAREVFHFDNVILNAKAAQTLAADEADKARAVAAAITAIVSPKA